MMFSIRSSDITKNTIKVIFALIGFGMVLGPMISAFNVSPTSSYVAKSRYRNLSWQDFLSLDQSRGERMMAMASQGEEFFKPWLKQYLYAHSYEDFLAYYGCELSDELAFDRFVQIYLKEMIPSAEERKTFVAQLLQRYPSKKDFLAAHHIKTQVISQEIQATFSDLAQSLSSLYKSSSLVDYSVDSYGWSVDNFLPQDVANEDLKIFYQSHQDRYQSPNLADIKRSYLKIPVAEIQSYLKGEPSVWTDFFNALQYQEYASIEALYAAYSDLISLDNAQIESYDRIGKEDFQELFNGSVSEDFFVQSVQEASNQESFALLKVIPQDGLLTLVEFFSPQPSHSLSFDQVQQQLKKDYAQDYAQKALLLNAQHWTQDSSLQAPQLLQSDVTLSLDQLLALQDLRQPDIAAILTPAQNMMDSNTCTLGWDPKTEQYRVLHIKDIKLSPSQENKSSLFNNVVAYFLSQYTQQAVEQDFGYHFEQGAWKTFEPFFQRAQEIDKEENF